MMKYIKTFKDKILFEGDTWKNRSPLADLPNDVVVPTPKELLPYIKDDKIELVRYVISYNEKDIKIPWHFPSYWSAESSENNPYNHKLVDFYAVDDVENKNVYQIDAIFSIDDIDTWSTQHKIDEYGFDTEYEVVIKENAIPISYDIKYLQPAIPPRNKNK